jgi:DNA-binding NarL/FixJ family response regulator
MTTPGDMATTHEMSTSVDAVASQARIVIADDQEVVRIGWSTILSSSGHNIVSTVSDGNALIRAVTEQTPDIAVVDVRMPGMDGLSAIEHLAAIGHVGKMACRVIIVTTFDDDDAVERALRAGAVGFLLKTARATELIDAVDNAMRGESTLAVSTTTRLIDKYLNESVRYDEHILAPLTIRERKVLELVGHGLSNQEICLHLHIAANTVKTHISSLLSKLAARDRAQLVVAAHRSGLLRSDHRHPEGWQSTPPAR